MKLNKMFLVGALLSLGFASCSKEGNGPAPIALLQQTLTCLFLCRYRSTIVLATTTTIP